eukprot:TRINITY_DN19878_c0_g1_i1.p1 TRINITY_DN19878_c0_g1~~TRINITY_DN19878_c0_g1_i1.p1  ORF type:complete len:316 (+),score=64.26 TRINITY_DN19878_c0_g1_i1:87-1034(+)
MRHPPRSTLSSSSAASDVYKRQLWRRSRPAKRNFAGKVVWITGASSGIGRALAHSFAAEGANLVLSARREHQLNEVAEECAQIARAAGLTARARVLAFDLESPCEQLAQHGATAGALYGRPVDILVNNGGVSSRSPAEHTSVAVDQRLMQINYIAPVALTKAVLPGMLTQQRGQLVVLSSVQGRLALPFRTSYSASKHALHGFFESLRAEVADRGVGVTLVCPGYVNTRLSLNAITGDGSAHDQVDPATAAGVDPAVLSQYILDAIAGNSHELVVAPLMVRVAITLRAVAPWLLARLMNRRARKQWTQHRHTEPS